ncbi:MAG: DNA cytosine methyltransferase [Chloroflexota bacterium]|nr:DNA cytosine methyltransferase [Chloroflexota bacterium]
MKKTSYLTVTDQFAGAGGSSLGAVAAGAEVVLALNHWKLAVETHQTNFPTTAHECTDISACNPRRYPSTDILITSPECVNHSIAKGQRRTHQTQMGLWEQTPLDPAEERSRATMWDVPRFADYHDYRLIIVENVVDARHWRLFDAWLKAMHALDYHYQIVYLNSMFVPPTPQSRDRMYVVFHKRGNRAPDLHICPKAYCDTCDRHIEAVQSWKNPLKKWGRYGRRRQYVYRCPACASDVTPFYAAAATAIDWTHPLSLIGARKKPLKDRTIRRIEAGLQKYHQTGLLQVTTDTRMAVVTPPFVVITSHVQEDDDGTRTSCVFSPIPTQTTCQDQALVLPYMVDLLWEHRVRGMDEPLSTVVAGGNHQALMLAPAEPAPGSFLVSYYGQNCLHSTADPVGTITTRDRHALVIPTAPSRLPRVEDCSFRMLQPSEVGRAMAFPATYTVLGNSRQQVRQYGNAVTPPVMTLLLERCIASLEGGTR